MIQQQDICHVVPGAESQNYRLLGRAPQTDPEFEADDTPGPSPPSPTTPVPQTIKDKFGYLIRVMGIQQISIYDRLRDLGLGLPSPS